MKTTTTEAAHYTPGPWRVEVAPITGVAMIRAGHGTRSRAICKTFDRLPESFENARLLAAAPALLAKLRETADALDTAALYMSDAGVRRDAIDGATHLAMTARTEIRKAERGDA